MRVVHIIPTFYPAAYFGGPVHSTYSLCNALARNHAVDLQVLTTDSSGPRRENRIPEEEWLSPETCGYEVCYCPKTVSKDFSWTLLRRLRAVVRDADVIHLTSAYSAPTIPTLFIARRWNKPVVWSPRGALQRWRGSSKGSIKAVWEAVCRRANRTSNCALHVTSEAEAVESRGRAGCGRVEVIPNGVDIPSVQRRRPQPKPDQLDLLFIGRLDPKKGIENLLETMARLPGGISLAICGTGVPGYQQNLQSQVRARGLEGRVRFEGHVSGEARERAFLNADLCLVPSHTENFGMVVAEALAYGLPVVASTGTPWAELETRACGLWVDNDPPSLASAVERAAGMDLSEMGRRGRQWMAEEYSWDAIAASMFALYESLQRGADTAGP